LALLFQDEALALIGHVQMANDGIDRWGTTGAKNAALFQ
jgi:hypothetical protein